MYFMQEAGEPLSLHYVQHIYGPYADNLRHVLRKVEGHLLAGYGDGGDAPDKQLALVPGAFADAERFLAGDQPTRARLDRVAALVDGFETPFGLELLATVHWVATHGSESADDVIAATYRWGMRKRRFKPEQIRLALDVLTEHGWLQARPTLG